MSRGNLALLVVVVVLAALVALEHPWSGAKRGYVERRPLFEEFDPAAVTSIVLERDGKSLTLARHDGRWVLGSERDYPANEGQVQQILAAVEQWKVNARVGTAEKAETYMVDEKNGTRVTLAGDGGEVLADLFTGRVAGFDAKEAQRQGGKVDTESFGIYVRRADAKDVYFMKGLFLGTFSPDTASFIDRSFVSFDPARAVRMTATCGADVLSITREVDGRLVLAGLTLPPDGDAIKTMVEAFSRLSATSLEGPYEPGQYGLEPPQCIVRAELDDGTSHVVEVGAAKEDKGYYARLQNGEFVVSISKWEVEGYRKKVEEFARKRLWDDKQPDITRIVVRRPGTSIEIEKGADQQWSLLTKEVGAIAADGGAAWKLVNAIANAEVRDYVGTGGAAPHGLDRPRLTAVATTAQGTTLELRLGDDGPDDTVYATTADSPWIVTVPRQVRDDLSLEAAELKKKEPPRS